MGRIRWVNGLVACGLVAWAATIRTLPVFAQLQRELSTDQRISLDLKGVDILDVLKLLSQQSGMNFVASRNVTGRITIFANDVDVWEAFERIIGANELAYERRGDIVTVMSMRDYELMYGEKFQERTQRLVLPLQYAKAIQVATALNQLKSSVGQVVVDEASNTLIVSDVPGRLTQMQGLITEFDRPTQTRVYQLNYADVEQLREKVQDLLSPIGTVTIDTRTNTAVITDLGDVLERIDRLVRAFDTPDGEVLIEAKIVKVDLTDEMKLGIDWQRVLSGIDTTAASNFDVIGGDVIGGSATGTALRLLSSSSDTEVVIEALESVSNTETLASPRIMVSNDQEARILVGTKEAFVTTTTTVPATGSTISSPSIEFVDVGTKLFVTPQIKRDGYVRLKIRPEVSSAETVTFQDNRIPIVTSTEAETTVLVKSGITVIIGGLISETITKTSNRVPWLGDLPIVGVPFRGTVEKTDKTELVVFLTPEIVLPDGSRYVPPAVEESSIRSSLSPIALNESVSVAYRHVIRQRLQEHLTNQFRLAALGRGSVVVSFMLDHTGDLIGEPTITSSQGESFIRAARLAMQQAQPLPSFPEIFARREVRFRLAVEYAP